MNLPTDRLVTPLDQNKGLRHGGDLTEALKVYGGEYNDWLNLSTGISPWSYPIPEIEESLWQSLPEKPEALLNAAADYYQCGENSITITPGSQIAIRLLPTLISSKQAVAVPMIGYQEHAHSWQLAGHKIIHYRNFLELNELLMTESVENVVVINPNNPSCEKISAADLRLIASQLPGLLIVDEAFADVDLNDSLSCNSNLSNIVVLRSIGKFFGLAGARIGFIITHHSVASKIAALLEPWSINAPAQHIAQFALNDQGWQERQRLKISTQSFELNKLLGDSIEKIDGTLALSSAGLFSTVSGDQLTIKKLHTYLAQQRIWARIGDPYVDTVEQNSKQNWLRLSLPGDSFNTLCSALKCIS